MNPFTPKTDRNLNSPHKPNTRTNMVSIRITENLNWRIIFGKKGNVTSNSRNEATKKHSYQLGEFLHDLGVYE